MVGDSAKRICFYIRPMVRWSAKLIPIPFAKQLKNPRHPQESRRSLSHVRYPSRWCLSSKIPLSSLQIQKAVNDVKYIYIQYIYNINQMTILVATTRNNSEHFQLVKSCQWSILVHFFCSNNPQTSVRFCTSIRIWCAKPCISLFTRHVRLHMTSHSPLGGIEPISVGNSPIAAFQDASQFTRHFHLGVNRNVHWMGTNATLVSFQLTHYIH